MSALGPRVLQGGRRTGEVEKHAEVSSFTATLPEVGLVWDALLIVHFSAHTPQPQRNLGVCLKRGALCGLKITRPAPP